MAEYRVNYTQSNFTGGIVSAELYGRNDFNKVKSGLKQCKNWTIREAGGLEFRRGTKYITTIPSAYGDDFKLSSLGGTPVVFANNGIHYLKKDNTFGDVSYPSGAAPDMADVGFRELKQKLYYYDGNASHKLGELSLSNVDSDGFGTVSAAVTKFESKPSATVTIAKQGTAPSPSVQVDYQYAISISKGADHESIAILSNVVQANVELGAGDSSSQRIDLSMTVSAADANAGGKVLIYKKYQGKYYYLNSLFLKAGETNYTYSDKGEFSVDVSRTIKELPPYMSADGTVAGVTSIADYNQRIFMTLAGYENYLIYSQVGNTESLAYSELRNEDEAGYQRVPITHFDGWSKVVSGLDLIFSTSYTINQIQGAGDLSLQTVLFDGFSKTVDPVATRRSLIYTNSNNRNIYDLAYNEYGQYDGVDLTLLVKYIFEQKRIKRLAFKDYPVKTIYVLCDDGDLYCLTYIKDQNIYAWYQIVHYGTIHDLIVVNRDTEDEIYLVVKDNGNYILEKAYLRTDSVYMDSVVKRTPVGNTITDLSMFEGKKVRVFDLANNRYYGDYDIYNPKTVEEGGNIVQIDDLDFDGYEVVDGKIDMPADKVLLGDVLVGIPYYAVMETIPLEFSDKNGNSTIGRKKTITEAYLRYGDSRGVTYKTLGKEYDCGIAKKDMSDSAEFLERGQVRLDVSSEYKWDSTIKILQRQPYPARIESITLGLHFNDKS
jgi:hypothetical protein